MAVTVERLNEALSRTEERFLHQLKENRQETDERFEQVDKRFEQVDKRFEQVDKRFEQVDKRFEQVDKRMEDLQYTVGNISAMFRNSNAVARWHDIHPVMLIDPTRPAAAQMYIPDDLPNKVIKFWRLTRPRNIPQLCRLLRAYGIQHLRSVEEMARSDSTSDSESEDEAPSRSLEEVVRQNPGYALSQLAVVLGLSYERIKTNMELYQDFLELRALRSSAGEAKRSRQSSSRGENSAKRTRVATQLSPALAGTKVVTVDGVQLTVSEGSSSITWPETVDYVTYGSQTPPRRALQDDSSLDSALRTQTKLPPDGKIARLTSPVSTHLLSGFSSSPGSQASVALREKP